MTAHGSSLESAVTKPQAAPARRLHLRPRWRKVLLDLWENKIRTLLVVASIAVGVFAIGMIAGTYVILSQDLRTDYASVNPANAQIVTDPFPPAFVRTIRRLDGVAWAEGRRLTTVRVETAPGVWQVLELEAIPDFEESRINRLRLLEGVAVPRDGQVLLESQTPDDLEVALGDELRLELADGTRRRLPIAGIVQDPTYSYGAILGRSKGYITYETLAWLHQPSSLNRLYVTVEERVDDREHISALTRQVVDRVERSGREVYQTELSGSSEHPLASILQALLGVLAILGVLVLFLSGSLIANTMTALLNQHLRQVGVMKLVGARRRQIVGMYLTLIGAFSLIALLFALPLGSWAAYTLAGFAARIINFSLQGFRVVPLAVIIQVVVAFLVPLGAGMLPVLRGSGTTVRKALGSVGLGGGQTAKSGLDGLLGRLRVFSRPLLLSIRNTFRRKGRLALTLFTLTLGGAIFISVFNTQVSLNLKVEELGRYFLADVNLDFARPYSVNTVTKQALLVPGVERVEAWIVTSAERTHEDGRPPDGVAILAPPVDSDLLEPVLLEGRWLRPGDRNAIVLNDAFWDADPDLGPGDSVQLEIGGEEETWRVVGIFQYAGGGELLAYANYDYLARELHLTNRATAYRIVTRRHDLAFQERVGQALDRHFRDRGYHVREVEAGGALSATIGDLFGVLTGVLLVMAVLTALVGSIGLTGTMSMNVLERTREIGVLRAIGAYDLFVMRLVIVEGAIIGFLSYALATLLSFPITRLLSNVISLAIFNAPARAAFTFQGFLIWLGVVLLLSVVASILPARNASRLTIREVLAYE
ncbi:MAG: ABC transporter permease [Anaerolineales bacterium]